MNAYGASIDSLSQGRHLLAVPPAIESFDRVPMTDLKNPHEELTKGDFVEAEKPFELFDEWLEEAKTTEPNDPNALALSTVDPDGLPNVRMVLLKGFDETGFVFYTNLESAKGRELLSAGKAAMCFHWKSLRRQIRIRGEIVQVSAEEADEYYQSRPRGSRIGAWASRQSRPLESRFALEKEVAKYTAKFGIGDIPRPEHWSGLRLIPSEIEFWADRPFRLHDRVKFTRSASSEPWSKERLYP
jgi:pyridoxamine 5'-phosphate oxidase